MTKKIPKARDRVSSLELQASSENSAHTIAAGTAVGAIECFWINPFFACTTRAIAAIGTKAIRLTAAAVFCGTSASSVISGMSSVPPPSPMPPNRPPANPMAMRTAVFTARV